MSLCFFFSRSLYTKSLLWRKYLWRTVWGLVCLHLPVWAGLCGKRLYTKYDLLSFESSKIMCRCVTHINMHKTACCRNYTSSAFLWSENITIQTQQHQARLSIIKAFVPIYQWIYSLTYTLLCLFFFAAKVFPGRLSLNKTFVQEMDNRASEQFQDTAHEIETAVRD